MPVEKLVVEGDIHSATEEIFVKKILSEAAHNFDRCHHLSAIHRCFVMPNCETAKENLQSLVQRTRRGSVVKTWENLRSVLCRSQRIR